MIGMPYKIILSIIISKTAFETFGYLAHQNTGYGK
jgi:hypothetical protein